MKKTLLDTKRLVTLSSLIAVAMILSYVESMIPVFIPIPGVKVGLSNIATVFALYTLGWPYAICVSVVRVLLSSLLFGSFISLTYSLFGAALALIIMIILMKTDIFSPIGISVAGGVFHNAGQVFAACLVMQNIGISLYMIPLVISGTLAGILIGIVSGILVKRIQKYI
jgi:heptaprenyl diphosphate synthase